MKRHFSLIFLTFCVLACNSDKNSKSDPLNQNGTAPKELYEKDTLPNGNIRLRPYYSLTKIDTGSIKLNFFDTIPETISVPAEFYTYDTTNLKSRKYIFLTDLVEYAILRVRGQDIYLRKEHAKCLTLPDNTFKDAFAGNAYSIIFIHKKVDHDNGATYEVGTLDIKNSRHQAIIRIHGGYKF